MINGILKNVCPYILFPPFEGELIEDITFLFSFPNQFSLSTKVVDNITIKQ